ncbi:hypothetical protein DFH07DRAFT_773270 [Mycena maculata]|uniref:Uncharacterized protein n=1 Tax=Mycena maculata TaxID=230809 RepID=A0AAD7J4F3_9AGAR|nr:hypothetical protein DFH07DRAFT_773270 [Mycena maculata]
MLAMSKLPALFSFPIFSFRLVSSRYSCSTMTSKQEKLPFQICLQFGSHLLDSPNPRASWNPIRERGERNVQSLSAPSPKVRRIKVLTYSRTIFVPFPSGFTAVRQHSYGHDRYVAFPASFLSAFILFSSIRRLAQWVSGPGGAHAQLLHATPDSPIRVTRSCVTLLRTTQVLLSSLTSPNFLSLTGSYRNTAVDRHVMRAVTVSLSSYLLCRRAAAAVFMSGYFELSLEQALYSTQCKQLVNACNRILTTWRPDRQYIYFTIISDESEHPYESQLIRNPTVVEPNARKVMELIEDIRPKLVQLGGNPGVLPREGFPDVAAPQFTLSTSWDYEITKSSSIASPEGQNGHPNVQLAVFLPEALLCLFGHLTSSQNSSENPGELVYATQALSPKFCGQGGLEN